MWGEHGNTSQDMIQFIILAVALVCVPVMLFPKPCIEINQMKKHKKLNPLHEEMDDEIGLEEKLNPHS